MTVYDWGGLLQPSCTLAYNGTGHGETIRTAKQEVSPSCHATCPDCGHPVVQHSREEGVGCLYGWDPDGSIESRLDCPCLRAGNSEADQ